MNDLETYFFNNKDRVMFKSVHYFEIYDRYFARLRGTDVHIMEIGVADGGSLQMWKSYFGPRSRVYGVDINPYCKQVEEKQIKVFIGDQGDKRFLKSLIEELPRIDILIDDGGHKMDQQINTFKVMFPHISENGIYICEDLHTSYSKLHGGGYGKKKTFVEYSKNFVDCIQSCLEEDLIQNKLRISHFNKSVHSVSWYDGMVVIEKRPVKESRSIRTGHIRLNKNYPVTIEEKTLLNRFVQWLRKPIYQKFLGIRYRLNMLTGSERKIKEFKFTAQDNPELPGDIYATIGDTYLQIDIPSEIDITSLKPTIKISEGAKVLPESGTESDFINQVVYTVTAKNGKKKLYEIHISKY